MICAYIIEIEIEIDSRNQEFDKPYPPFIPFLDFRSIFLTKYGIDYLIITSFAMLIDYEIPLLKKKIKEKVMLQLNSYKWKKYETLYLNFHDKCHCNVIIKLK